MNKKSLAFPRKLADGLSVLLAMNALLAVLTRNKSEDV